MEKNHTKKWDEKTQKNDKKIKQFLIKILIKYKFI